jgi:hypothetical protein
MAYLDGASTAKISLEKAAVGRSLQDLILERHSLGIVLLEPRFSGVLVGEYEMVRKDFMTAILRQRKRARTRLQWRWSRKAGRREQKGYPRRSAQILLSGRLSSGRNRLVLLDQV